MIDQRRIQGVISAGKEEDVLDTEEEDVEEIVVNDGEADDDGNDDSLEFLGCLLGEGSFSREHVGTDVWSLATAAETDGWLPVGHTVETDGWLPVGHTIGTTGDMESGSRRSLKSLSSNITELSM